MCKHPSAFFSLFQEIFDGFFDNDGFLTYTLRWTDKGVVMRRHQQSRLGAAAVELAVLLPLLIFLFVITLEWGRVFYYSVTMSNAARQGAIYLCDPVLRAQSPYT